MNEPKQKIELFDYFIRCITQKYLCTTGRARRKEFWGFVLFNALVTAGIMFVLMLTAIWLKQPWIGGLINLYSLAVFLPNICVAVRRLHDTNRSGFWILIGFIPVVGAIILLVFFLQSGTRGRNNFGVNPLDYEA